MKAITNTEDTIDSNDIIDRVKELEGFLAFCPHCGEGIDLEDAKATNRCPDCEQELLEDREIDELDALQDVINQAGGCDGFDFGEALVSEDYFTEYCQELCEDCGDISSDMPWYITCHIDWDGVARDIRMDYSEVGFDGATYFIRR